MIRRLVGALALTCLSALPLAAQAACRLSLQLALDVSGSVNAQEYRLQLDGVAWALQQPDVQLALLAMPTAPVSLSVYEWSGRDNQRVIVDWWVMRSEADVTAVADLLRNATRRETPVSTAIGTALLFGQARLSQAPECARWVIDISGDGKNNDGPRPQVVRSSLEGMQVNALVIGPGYGTALGAMARETEDLVRYFRSNVINGPTSFVEVADGYESFAEAMKRKLLRELDVVVLGRADIRPSSSPDIPDQ